MHQMPPEWINMAELMGAVAIVVSLVYVSLQVRGTTSAIRSAETGELQEDEPE